MHKLILSAILLLTCSAAKAQQVSFTLQHPQSATQANDNTSTIHSIIDKKIRQLSLKYEHHTGWLSSFEDLYQQLPQLTQWVKTVKSSYKYCVVLGMGGSSLSAEALRQIFGKRPGFPEMFVLDTSHPDSFLKIEDKIHLSETLFIVASKSGTTTETTYAYEYFYNKISQLSSEPGKHFLAITDEGSPLQQIAQENNFTALFLNRKDIGGRFSALSYFGMVPALLSGYDVEGILQATQQQRRSLSETPSHMLFSLIDALTPKGENSSKRVFLVLDKKLTGYGWWIEQLLSESLGKSGKGIIPLVTNSFQPDLYQKGDVIIEIAETPSPKNKADVFLPFKKPSDIGKHFLLWELATSYVGEKMQINPFDQPDVDLSKKLTKSILAKGNFPQNNILLSKSLQGIPSQSLNQLFKTAIQSSAYMALLLYTAPTEKDLTEIEKWKKNLDKPVIATPGPRYLHSLGQLYKGGENFGLFLIITQVKNDLSFGNKNLKELLLAQAYGDFQAMDEKNRDVILVNLSEKESVVSFLKDLLSDNPKKQLPL